MRKSIVILALFFLVGCSYGTADLKTVITDPHYAGYQKQLDDLEHSYLRGDVSYPDYLLKKQQIEDNYTKEVKQREATIHQTGQ